MWAQGQWFSQDVLKRITDAMAAEPGLSRRMLSRRVCDWLEWRGPGGKPCEMGCRKALVELQRRGVVALPAALPFPGRVRCRARKEAVKPPSAVQVRCSLKDLGVVEVVPVSSRYSKDSRIWKELMNAHHYLGAGPLCGAQIRYLIRSETAGVLGCLSFSSATQRLSKRDEFIGWSERARRANLKFVVCNSRFLIDPRVQVRHLASHVLSLALKRLPGDWQERYGYLPVLVETFVDRQRFQGTCYRAANWMPLGQTAGRPDGFRNGKKPSGKKDLFVYPLKKAFRTPLCEEPRPTLVLRGPVADAKDWADEEFGAADIVSQKLSRRLRTLARDFFQNPGASVPVACNGSVAKTKAAYRFFENGRVDMRAVLSGHIDASVRRAQQHKMVLAVQDTTTLNYSAHPTTEDLGPINTTRNRAVGLILHTTLAVTPEGTPLGILDGQCWARDPKKAGKCAQRRELPIEEKESAKWLRSYRAAAQAQRLCPDTVFVSTGDREADIHELFQEAAKTAGGPQLLIRANKNRQRRVETEPTPDGVEDHQYLWDRLPQEPLAGILEIALPRQGKRRARTARLEVRYAAVSIQPPKKKPHLEPVAVWAVHAREVGASVSEPIHWMILTTLAVDSFEKATERLRCYALRWGIEVFHRVLKSGCRIEDRQLGTAATIQACLAIDMVVAWRIHWLTMQGRETPEMSCDVILKEEEWQVLCVHRTGRVPSEPPPLREAIRMIAALGGFLGRKGDGEPGTTAMWLGLQKLENMAIGYRLGRARPRARSRDGP